jgi:exodeoxyribonuclease VII large subunit
MAARLRHPREQLAEARHRLDALGTRLDHAMKTVAAREQAALERNGLRLEQSAARLAQSLPRLLDDRARRVAHAGQLLESFSYRKVLERGFTVIRDAEGRPVSSAQAAKPGAALGVEFADGTVGVRVEGAASPAAPKSPKKPAAPDGRQGSLL